MLLIYYFVSFCEIHQRRYWYHQRRIAVLPSTERSTTGEDIFNLTNAYFAENEIDWSRCVDICTDGATSVTGKHAGFIARTKEAATNISWTDCCIHRQALASKRMP
jgi:hypothetical protein